MPRSAQQIAEDNDAILFSVVILRKFADQVRAKLREKKFTPREYTFEKSDDGNKEKSIQQLIEKRQAARLDLWKFCKAQFSEMFTCWVHLKTVRIWVESIVRFSLPANFDVVLIKPDRRYTEKIRKSLHDLFGGLVGEGVLDMGGDDSTPQGMPSFVSEELYPYVFTELSLLTRMG